MTLQGKVKTSVPLSFIAVGIVSLLAGMCWLVIHPETLAAYHYNQHIIALTHLFTLGWICSVIMGAMYQLIPVALETKLYNERLPAWHLALHIAGFIGMVWMFSGWNITGVAFFGLVLASGVVLFVYNLSRTLARIPRWNVVAGGVTSALTWLLFTIVAGLLLAGAKRWAISPFDPLGQMHAHAHLGVLGFFITLIVGVSYKLIPMFALSEVQNHRRAWASLSLINFGTAILFLTILLGSLLKLTGSLLVIAGLLLYGWELTAILRARKRRPLDWGLKHFITAIILLLPLGLMALTLSWPGLPLNEITGRLENAYGFLALLGVVSFAIIGMLYKIVPFLVWFKRYSPEIGRRKVPSLGDLYSVRLQIVGYWLFLPGLIITSLGTFLGHVECLQKGLFLLFASIVVFATNIGKICLHLLRPKREALPIGSALKGVS